MDPTTIPDSPTPIAVREPSAGTGGFLSEFTGVWYTSLHILAMISPDSLPPLLLTNPPFGRFASVAAGA
jgi:hypothetical protein